MNILCLLSDSFLRAIAASFHLHCFFRNTLIKSHCDVMDFFGIDCSLLSLRWALLCPPFQVSGILPFNSWKLQCLMERICELSVKSLTGILIAWRISEVIIEGLQLHLWVLRHWFSGGSNMAQWVKQHAAALAALRSASSGPGCSLLF